MKKKLLNILLAVNLFYSCDYSIYTTEGKYYEQLHLNQRYISLREAPPASTIHLSYQAYNTLTDSYKKKIQLTSIDSSGFINPSQNQTNANFNIYFLGGSTTACFEVVDSLKFVNLVQRSLAMNYQLNVNTFNAGYPGNSSLSSYNKLVNVILPQQPNMVVLMHNFNDLAIMLYQGDYWSTKVMRGKVRRKVEILRDKSQVAYLAYLENKKIEPLYKLKEGLNGIFSVFNSTEKEWHNNKQNPNEIDIQQLESDFKSSLITFIRTCRIYNAEPVLMTQANFLIKDPPVNSLVHQYAKNIMQGSGYDYHKIQMLYTNLNQIIKDLANQENVTLIDLEKKVPKKSTYFLDLVHLNQRGSQLVAEIISQEFAKTIVKPQ
ncbi:hypothetical protein GYB57_06700 [bacterium]|nr:hypothetical protein [bacterium]